MSSSSTTPGHEAPVASFVRELVVADVVRETVDACTLVFEPPADPEHFRYAPGQFLTLRIPSDREPTARCYSLSSSPRTDELMAVTVKRTPDGYASNWICDNVRPGTRMHVLSPSGQFVPRSLDEDLLLCAAGSGITPMMAILKAALADGDARITLLYANRDQDSVIFAEALRLLAEKHPERLTILHWLESLQGLPTSNALAVLLGATGAGRPAYLCGPGAFMDVVTNGLREAGWPNDAIHLERFHSITGDPFAAVAPIKDAGDDTAQVRVTLDGETHDLTWPRAQFLLDTMLAAGLDAPFSCREGSCSACACVLREGEAEMACNDVLDEDDVAAGQVLACQLRPLSDRLVVEYD